MTLATNVPGLFAIVQGVKAQARAGAAPPAFPMPNVPGRAAGGDISMSDPSGMGGDPSAMYATMANGPMDAAPPPAPSGGNPVMGATDPLAPILMQIAAQYHLVDANGQPDLETARQIYMKNPTAFAGGGDATGQAPLPGPNIPGVSGGVPGAEGGGRLNVAGYDGTINQQPWQATTSGPQGGAPQGGPPDAVDPASHIYFDIAQQYKLVDPVTGELDVSRAADLYRSNQAYFDSLYAKSASASDSGMAGVAERADEFAKQMAFDQQKEAARQAEMRQQVGTLQEQAKQDFYNSQEALKTARENAQTSRASAALNAWTSMVGHTNVPGIGNYSLAGGQAAENTVQGNRPILNYNPLEAMGASPQWTDNTAPNIPGVDYGNG